MSLTVEYFKRRGYKISKDQGREQQRGSSGFDLVVSYRKISYPVRVRDWNRTVGVNIVISLDKASQAASFTTPILIADKFSEHARAYASRRGIMLVTRSEIMRSLR